MAENINELEYFESLLPNVGREGISTAEVLNEYNKWAGKYEEDMVTINYVGYKVGASKICELFQMGSRAGVKILDVGAGTGLLGLLLKDEGFAHLDALDPSEDMMTVAMGKGIYEHYFIEYLTDKPLAIEQNTYDAVIGTGMFGYSLVPYTAIYEMVRLTKPGGYVILSNKKVNISLQEYENLEPTMEKMEKEGKWKKICRTIYPNFVKNVDGLLHVYQKL